jgi:8-oxo-dGTP pyrophosphatase MutT (NUDIX family)
VTPDHFAAALLVDEQGRYLMQIRDDVPHILHPGALGLFGGALEAGEDAGAAVRRELDEEIGFVPRDLGYWRTLWVPLRQADGSLRSGRVVVFVGAIAAERVPDMDQREGAGRLLIGPRSLLLEANVTPSARLAVGLHAQAAMASGGAEPVTERWAARV